MSNPIFNPTPRCIIIQPTKDSDIFYYMAVMDIPDSMCTENPFSNSNQQLNKQVDGSSKDITIVLPAGIQFSADFTSNSSEDFKTYLIPIYSFSKTEDNFYLKENIIVQDEKGNQKTGPIHHSKSLTLFNEPYTSPGNKPDRLMAFRPFVIQNTSYQNCKFFVGGFLKYDSNQYPNWGLTFDYSKSIVSQPRLILEPYTTNESNKSSGKSTNFLDVFESDYNSYESIELTGDTDPDDAGLFQYDQGKNLYDYPIGMI